MTGLQRDLLRRGVAPCAVLALLMALALGWALDNAWLGMAAATAVMVAAWLSQRWLTRRVVQPLRELADRTGQPGSDAPAHELQQLRAGIDALVLQLATQRSDADHRVRSSVAEALQRWSEAQAAHHGKSQFLAAVGDRLRQPLYAMSLFIGALQRDATPAQRASIDRLQGAAEGMGSLLEELLDIARLDAHVVEAEPRPLLLRDWFTEQAAAFAERVQSSGVQLRWRDGGLGLYGDELLLGRLLHHLVGNAIEHAPGGRVLVAARRCGEHVRLEVRDNGRGIARIHQARIFEEFVQLGDDRRERRLGLGLPICSRIAALMGSHIDVRSELGRGSTFSIDLPRAHAEEMAPTRAASAR